MTGVHQLRSYFEARTEDMVAHLQGLVEIESPTRVKRAVDRLGALVARQAKDLGARVTLERQTNRGDHVVARWNESPADPQLLILCHLDTVWPLGTLDERPVYREDGRLYGPGCYDMKASVTLVLAALRGLQRLNLWPLRPITVLFTSDEELGSRTSRSLIEHEAQRSALVMVMEPSLNRGGLKTSRKGTGRVLVVTRGVPAHAGAAHDEGVNAIEEMAHQILALQRMTDYARGTTINVGRIQGGERTNIVPDQAKVWVDMRVTSQEEGQRMLEQVSALAPQLPGASVQVKAKLSRPPMPRDALMIQTFQQAADIAAEIGLQLGEGKSGGASDANFCAALGVPTLDGLGPLGDGAHAYHEHVRIASLPERAALLAALLHRWP